VKIRETRTWMKHCPEWCDGKHLDGSIFLGAHTKTEVFSPPPQKIPGSRPSTTWVRERLLISGTTYMSCISSDRGRVLLVIDPNETVEHFEERFTNALPRIMRLLGESKFDEHEFEDLDSYVQGY